MDLKEALKIRIPQITDKEHAFDVIQGHVNKGSLTQEEGQFFADQIYQVQFDEDGNALTERRIISVEDYMSPEEEIIELEGVIEELLQRLADKGVL